MSARRISTVTGSILPLRGDDIDTDRIIPARFLLAVTFDGLERNVFRDDRDAAANEGTAHPFDNPVYAGASVLVVNGNFGCGSSREHAPQALQRWGIRAIVGESFAEIFFDNCVLMGMPCVVASPDSIRALMAKAEADPTVQATVDVADGRLTAHDFSVSIELPPHVKAAFLSGSWDITGMLLERYDEVNSTAENLPYVNQFRTRKA